jgi:hypothetical protein
MFGSTSTPTPGDTLISALGAAVDDLAAFDPADQPPASLLTWYVRLRGVRDRFDAHLARVGAVVDAQGEWRADGSRSFAARVAREAGEPGHVARHDARIARSLAAMPATAEALVRGELARGHVDVLVHAAGGARRDLYRRDEAMLIGFATELDGAAFVQAVRSWEHAADDELAPADPGAEVDLDAIGIDVRRACARHENGEGRWRYVLDFDRLGGAEFTTAFDHVEHDLFKADYEEARVRLGREPVVTELRRTATQRRLDTVTEMARRAMSAPPGSRKPAPLATVVIGSERHAQLLQLASGTPITLAEGLRVMLDGEVERATFDTPNRVQISETARLFTGATRRGIEIRDLTCSFVGITRSGKRWRCQVPAHRCDVDHEIPFEDGGPTIQDNGRLRCPAHHSGRMRDQPYLDGERAQLARWRRAHALRRHLAQQRRHDIARIRRRVAELAHHPKPGGPGRLLGTPPDQGHADTEAPEGRSTVRTAHQPDGRNQPQRGDRSRGHGARGSHGSAASRPPGREPP